MDAVLDFGDAAFAHGLVVGTGGHSRPAADVREAAYKKLLDIVYPRGT